MKTVGIVMLGLSLVATAVYAGCGTCDKTIVSAAKHDKNFATLVTAVEKAGLADALSGDEQLTVFAPVNSAFAKLPEGAVAELLKPENKNELVKVLTYHVVPGRVKAKDVASISSAKTLEGSDLSFTHKDGKVLVNNAEVLKADIPCKNGVIHVIDAVLIPKS